MANVFENDLLHTLFTSIPGGSERDYWEQQKNGLSFHKGITRLEDGSFLILEQRQWIEQESIGYPISMEDALKEITSSNNLHLLNHPKFNELKIMYEKTRNTP